MPPKIWTPQRNENLLLLLVDQIKTIDAEKLVEAWRAKYPDEDFEPTPRAIKEQIGVLRKRGGGGAATGSTPKAPKTTASTPKKTATAKTPTSTPGSKRKKTVPTSDDEELEDDSEPNIKSIKLPEPKKRASHARTKKVPKRYEESEVSGATAFDDEDDAFGNIKPEPYGGKEDTPFMEDNVHVAAKPRPNGELDSIMDGVMGKVARHFAPSKSMAFGNESDVSDFDASTF